LFANGSNIRRTSASISGAKSPSGRKLNLDASANQSSNPLLIFATIKMQGFLQCEVAYLRGGLQHGKDGGFLKMHQLTWVSPMLWLVECV
jgi:hypothetical protein